MWLEKFSAIINRLFPSDPIAGIEDVLIKLNPDKFYLENVRSLLRVSYEKALQICETAVRQGFFERRVEVLCPNGKVAASADIEAHLPPTVTCWQEEDGHYEEIELPTSQLQKLIFYRLNDKEADRFYRKTA